MSTFGSNGTVAVGEQDGIAIVSLRREAQRNAMNGELIDGLTEAAESLRSRVDAFAVVFRADGEHFSAGADLDDLESFFGDRSVLVTRREAERGARLLRAIREIHQPTICAVRGVAIGAGACIPAACDFRVAAKDARIGYAEVRMGMNLMWHAIPDLVGLVGPARARQMAMSGRLFDADRLAQWGFLDETCPADELDDRALAWAREYASLPPLAVQMIKRSINRYAQPLGEAVMHMDADQWTLATMTEDFRECVDAAREKRAPRPTGR
ncbi:MAG: enoyl-CoA hydratase/isomerase family protein [Pseudomonadota bacterium]